MEIEIRAKRTCRVKINTLILKNLKSKLDKIVTHMPKIKRRPICMRRICSPTKIENISRRIISPNMRRKVEFKRNIDVNKSNKLSPTNAESMFREYTAEQKNIIDKISNRIAEAKSYRLHGFRSPRVLSRTLFRENNFLEIRNNSSLRQLDENLISGDFVDNKNTKLFQIERIKRMQNSSKYNQL